MKNSLKQLILLTFIILTSSCAKDDQPFLLLPEEGEELSGGTVTVFDFSQNAFGLQAPNLSDEESLLFFVGNSFFNQNWVTAPASTTARDGLGPLFNARACSSCHFKDGRGRAPEFSGELAHGLLLRVNIGNDINGAPLPDPNYGGQIQDQAIPNIDTEAGFEVTYEEITGSYPDGTSYSLRKPSYIITNQTFGELSTNARLSPRVANQMIGLGLLEAIDETIILSLEDENDTNNDGISGKANYVWDVSSQSLKLGRFGWKANQPSILQQIAAAFSGDLGITSSVFPNENCPPGIDCASVPNGGEPEISDENFNTVLLYSSTLAVPARRDVDKTEVLEGKQLFEQINCVACHLPKITTGTHPTINALSNQTIRPYTDMLLHDMGDGLSDNSQDFLATKNEWRTPPLWGLGLIKTVNGHTYLLHDGRARNTEEAILWHDGEAKKAKNAFMELTKTEREKIITFIQSL
ncbi:di-heme oxidoreductase family protein [Abyssalbus ytuae]|uniref:C-type cytochrome n=1 Tax=Abyssalbus ytuae TaxID=2926907 RepID=A0A9E7D3L8_9FLAO|nr:di-heme oxidoredictase family protein [Abyssalbus ytuae]UOB17994.1 c-type cytochrome [Abyssalbus ytuae]